MISKTECICSYCNKTFKRRTARLKYEQPKKLYCSHKCHVLDIDVRVNKTCYCCGKDLLIKRSELSRSKSGFCFCSNSCAAKYNNSIRKKTRRSKIEIKFGQELQKLFPTLQFLFNDKTIISGYELDIYIPELKLAIEWNGIVHYQPIYGEEKLEQIQYRDYQKQLLCQKYDINLIVIADYKSNKTILNESLTKVSEIINKLM